MIVYGIVRKDDPERKMVRARGGHIIFAAKSSVVNAMCWRDGWQGRKDIKKAEETYEIVEFDLVERKANG